MATLYEMTEQGRELYEMLEAGEIDEEVFKDTLEAIGVNEKIDTYCQIIRQRKADAEMYKAEKERLYAKQKAAENDAERMRTALMEFMNSTGQTKTKTQLFSCSISSRQVCQIIDESSIPAEYRTPQPDKIEKTDILKALKAGAEIPGAEISTTNSLTIR